MAISISMDNQTYIYTLFTLVDITPTGVRRAALGKELERNQQRNWETVLQCIGLVTQPNVMSWGMIEPKDSFVDAMFGEKFDTSDKTRKVWYMTFNVDREDVFRRGNDPVALLDECFDEVPVVTYLTETVKFMLPIFYTSGPIKNIHFISGPKIR